MNFIKICCPNYKIVYALLLNSAKQALDERLSFKLKFHTQFDSSSNKREKDYLFDKLSVFRIRSFLWSVCSNIRTEYGSLACFGVSFFIKLQTSACKFTKKDSPILQSF